MSEFTHDPIEAALGNLRETIRMTLRAEQLRDRLTGLGNDEALTELLESSVEAVVASGAAFWVAFIEVDRFKSINDEFSYQDADALLQRIGDRLRVVARDYFPSAASPIRAHGDEFFLLGKLEHVSAEQIQRALDSLRSEISLIRITVREKPRPMQCTVSIGWLTSEDAQKAKSGLTGRAVRGCLELAVARAKIDRDTVVRFAVEMEKAEVRHGRADCGTCGAKFSITIPISAKETGDMNCPNCNANIQRPPGLQPEGDVPQ